MAGASLAGGLVQERDLRGGETHSYPVELPAGQFLRVKVQEQGIDVDVRLLDPQGRLSSPGLDQLQYRSQGLARRIWRPLPGLGFLPPGDRLRGTRKATARPVPFGGRSPPAGHGRRGVPSGVKRRGRGGTTFHPAPGQSGDKALERSPCASGASRRAPADGGGPSPALEPRNFHPFPARRRPGIILRSASLWREQPDPEARNWEILAAQPRGQAAQDPGPSRPRLGSTITQPLAIAQGRLGDLGSQAASLSNLAMLDIDQGELPRGVSSLQESLRKAREADDRVAQTRTLNNLGYAYAQLAEGQKALQSYQHALDLARALSNAELEAYALNNLGYTYLSLGDSETALKHFRQALAINRQLRARATEAGTLINIGDTLLRLKRFDEARKSFDQALALARKLKDLENQTFALTNQAFLFLKLKQPALAAEAARQALGLAQGFPDREVTALYALGSAHRDLGELPAAREKLEKALSQAHEQGDRTREAEIGLRLAQVERETGNIAKALERIRSVVDIVESIRTRVFEPRLRASFLAAKQDSYETYVDTLMASPGGAPPASARIAEALQVNERARARSLLDILNESGADVRVGADPALVEREHRLRDEVNARDGYHFKLRNGEKPDRRKLEEAEHKLEETLDAYGQVQAELRASSPGYAALTQPQPLSVAEIQSQVLDGKALLLEYALGTKRSFLWVVTPDAIRSFELPGRERIERAARRYYELVTARNQRRTGESLADGKRRIDAADAEAERVGRDLSRLLLAPAERLLGDRPLLIVADGALQYIPFAALPISASGAPAGHSPRRGEPPVGLGAGGAAARGPWPVPGTESPGGLWRSGLPGHRRTIDRPARPARPHEARVRHPGRTEAGETAAAGARSASLSSGSSRSGKEARAIAALVPPGQRFLALGFEASRSQATSPELRQYRNVHFATHGVLDSRRPELSRLVLSLYDKQGKTQDGFLRLNDIYNLHLGADLVVLSACQTALGQEIRGRGAGRIDPRLHVRRRGPRGRQPVERRGPGDGRADGELLSRHAPTGALPRGRPPPGAARDGRRAGPEVPLLLGRLLPPGGVAVRRRRQRRRRRLPAERLRGLTPEGFDALLTQLHPDRDRAGEIYETIRRKLVRLFEWRGCALPGRPHRRDHQPRRPPAGRRSEVPVERSLRLLLRRRPPGLQGGPAPGIPRAPRDRRGGRLASRHFRGRRRIPRPPARLPPPVPRPAHAGPAGPGAAVSPGKKRPGRRGRPGESNIRNRQKLADEAGIPMNALRIRVHRLRRKLESCVHACLSH